MDIPKNHLGTIISTGGVGAGGYLAGRRKNGVEATRLEAEAQNVTIETVVAGFRAPIDGYEAEARADNARIEDLTREVRKLRDEDKALRKALETAVWEAGDAERPPLREQDR